MRGLDDLAREYISQTIDVGGAQIDAERVAPRDQPALDRRLQVDLGAGRVLQNAVLLDTAGLRETQAREEHLRRVEVGARQDRHQRSGRAAVPRLVGHGLVPFGRLAYMRDDILRA
ncbi:MAG: hypothetical protein ACRYFW_08515 [Janthinobacterium lividum]